MWFEQKFSNGDTSYFLSTGVCKNKSLKGLAVFVELGSRCKLRPKSDTIPAAYMDLWRRVEMTAVPFEVLEAVTDWVNKSK